MPRDGDLSEGEAPHQWRQHLMQACAFATEAELVQALDALQPLPAVEDVRRAEVGLVMLRGRIGGDGAPFNAGEATVTRAVVRLETGEVGFSYLLGRSAQRARLAAILDALGQKPELRARIETAFVAPLAARREAGRAADRAETAATRVQFFTLVRGED